MESTSTTERTEEPAPIIYACFRPKKLRGCIPPAVARHVVTRHCSRCRTKVILVGESLDRVLQLAARTGRKIELVCDRCARRIRPDLMTICPPGPKLAATMAAVEAATGHE